MWPLSSTRQACLLGDSRVDTHKYEDITKSVAVPLKNFSDPGAENFAQNNLARYSYVCQQFDLCVTPFVHVPLRVFNDGYGYLAPVMDLHLKQGAVIEVLKENRYSKRVTAGNF